MLGIKNAATPVFACLPEFVRETLRDQPEDIATHRHYSIEVLSQLFKAYASSNKRKRAIALVVTPLPMTFLQI